jgi:hypothetical protein
MDAQEAGASRKRHADFGSDHRPGRKRSKNNHEPGGPRANFCAHESLLIRLDLSSQVPSPAISEEEFFAFYREQERAKEEESDDEDDSSDGEFEKVINRNPVAAVSTRSPSAATDNNDDDDKGGGGDIGSDDWDEFEDTMFKGITENTPEPDTPSTKPGASQTPTVDTSKDPGLSGSMPAPAGAPEKSKKKKKYIPKQSKAPAEFKITANGKEVRTKAGRKKLQKEKENIAGIRVTEEQEEAAKALRAQKKKANTSQNGYTVGKHDAPLPVESFQYESDHELSKNDPYFEKGCERRMVFTSDSVLKQDQYKLHDVTAAAQRTESFNAVDKFFNWYESRPTSARRGRPDWDEEGYNDSRKARHFVLKMGLPNGLYGHPTKLAARLKSTWSHLFIKRLRSSHLTIETEIPFHTLAGTDYFKAYMDQIIDLTSPKKLGNRLTVKLEDGPTDILFNASPKTFYTKEIDVEQEWRSKISVADERRRFVLSLVDPHNADRQPTLDDIRQAEGIFKKSRELQNTKQQDMVNKGIDEVKKFIQTIRKFEESKNPTITASNTSPNEKPITSTVPANAQCNGSEDSEIANILARPGYLGKASRYTVEASRTQMSSAASTEQQPAAVSQGFIVTPSTAMTSCLGAAHEPVLLPAAFHTNPYPDASLGVTTGDVPHATSLSPSDFILQYHFAPATISPHRLPPKAVIQAEVLDQTSEFARMSQAIPRFEEHTNPDLGLHTLGQVSQTDCLPTVPLLTAAQEIGANRGTSVAPKPYTDAGVSAKFTLPAPSISNFITAPPVAVPTGSAVSGPASPTRCVQVKRKRACWSEEEETGDSKRVIGPEDPQGRGEVGN